MSEFQPGAFPNPFEEAQLANAPFPEQAAPAEDVHAGPLSGAVELPGSTGYVSPRGGVTEISAAAATMGSSGPRNDSLHSERIAG